MRRTKIVATLGPACRPSQVLKDLLAIPVDVFRINASHGTQSEHAAHIGAIRRCSEEFGSHPGILLDLQGPKIRLGKFAWGSAVLQTGAEFTIATPPLAGNAKTASTDCPNFAAYVAMGDRILLGDGEVTLRAVKVADGAVTCEVTAGGVVRDHLGIHLPNARTRSSLFSLKDLSDLDFGLKCKVDSIALSFVRNAGDIVHCREVLAGKGSQIPIIAKIESAEACRNLDEIVAAADGVMVARGDLGLEMSLVKVPALQKKIIERSRRMGKFVVTATQMLESMSHCATPTRAEVSDIANAVYDGTDALMLSAETATGKYPVNAARVMAEVATEIDADYDQTPGWEFARQAFLDDASITADACCRAARSPQIKAIVVFTSTGATARLIARHHPPVPTFAFAPDAGVARSLAVLYGTRAFCGIQTSLAAMLQASDRILVESGCLRPGDSVVVAAGEPMGTPGSTNQIRLHRIGERPPERIEPASTQVHHDPSGPLASANGG